MCTRIYVGNLPMDIRTRELDDLFYKYGRILDIDIKFPSRPPAFAFIEFEDDRDAEDAIRGRDGYKFDGARIRVEPTRGNFGGGPRRNSQFGRNLPGSGKYGLDVSGLPDGASWQDLKDHVRPAGDVIFTKVNGRGGGFVEFSNKDDMEKALTTLDQSEFKCKSGTSVISIKEAARRGRSRSRSRSRSDSRSRSRSRSSRRRSRSPRKKRSYSRSSSRGKRSRSRSHSRSRSESSKRSQSPEDKRNSPKKDDVTNDGQTKED